MARWRAGRCCRLATSARRSDSRATTTAAGSSAAAASRLSGSGSSHETSPGARYLGGWSDSLAGPPRPDGRTRVWRDVLAVRQTLVAIVYSHDRTDARPSNPL
ncbi:Uncharacterised protein [Nocardia africana]|uniref:Uncharacterized protein n=1 Tax=Nocardia africana TaxID=134964 RepID=A0A378WVL0_9NOCA|nr:Uncharacterised protein [Nocardia africana]